MTLLELVVVLIVIGALASFALPKYIDYSGLAMGRLAESVRIEAQIQIDAAFVTALRRGYPCEEASATSAVLSNVPKLSRVTVYGASEKSEAPYYGEASAEGGNPVTMSISF